MLDWVKYPREKMQSRDFVSMQVKGTDVKWDEKLFFPGITLRNGYVILLTVWDYDRFVPATRLGLVGT